MPYAVEPAAVRHRRVTLYLRVAVARGLDPVHRRHFRADNGVVLGERQVLQGARLLRRIPIRSHGRPRVHHVPGKPRPDHDHIRQVHRGIAGKARESEAQALGGLERADAASDLRPSVLCGLRVRTVLFSLLRTVRQAPWSRGGSGSDLLTANGPFAAPDRRAATSERQAAYCSHLQGPGPNGAGEEGGRQGRDHQRGNGGPGDQHVNSPRCGAYS